MGAGRVRWWGLPSFAFLGMLLVGLLPPVPVAASSPPVMYYLSLGDSIAAGTGSSSPLMSYAGLVYQHELARYPGLEWVSLACGGQTTTSMISGPDCPGYSDSQLQEAEGFLAGRRGQVALVTVDIGLNDIDGCFTPTAIDASCLQAGETATAANLPQILSGLSAADPGVPIVGMNYYDPYLVYSRFGSTGAGLASQSLGIISSFNSELSGIFSTAGASTADVATAFATYDTSPSSFDGTPEPTNLATLCNFTSLCTTGDIHPDDAGHAAIFSPFEPYLPPQGTGGTEPPDSGYWLVGSDGGVFSFGSAQFFGSTGSLRLQRPVVGISPSANDNGYWLVASDGGVFGFGHSQFHGSIPGLGIGPAGSTDAKQLNAPIVGIVPTSDGGGYLMVAADGGVFSFGDARFEGSCPGIGGCNGAAVSVVPDATGKGYWLFTATGNVYAFGDAVFYGAPGPQPVPVTSAAAATNGYWILFSNGVVAAYGGAASFTMPPEQTNDGLTATTLFSTPDGGGYWVATADGHVFDSGDAVFEGDISGSPLNGPIIAGAGW